MAKERVATEDAIVVAEAIVLAIRRNDAITALNRLTGR
jgi:hypothetical protein